MTTKKSGKVIFSNNHEDLLIEYADEDNTNSRIFYGLKSNGENYFPTEYGFFEYNTTENSAEETEHTNSNRFESLNYFVTLKNENNEEKEYLFSLCPHKNLIELQDLNSEDNQRYSWDIKTFINYTEYDIFPSQLFLMGIKDNSEFIISFGINDGKNETSATLYMIKKFKLKSFCQDPYEDLGFINVTRPDQSKRKTFFSIDLSEFFIFVPVEIVSDDYRYSGEVYFYNFKYIMNCKLTDYSNIAFKDEMFFKSIILKENYLAFLYFSEINKGESLYISVIQFINESNNLSKKSKFSYNIKGINYVTNVSMSDFFRLDETRAGFISTEGNPDNINRKLHIILFHFSADYSLMRARRYSYSLTNYIFLNELSGTFYNGHLVLSATAILRKDIMLEADWTNYFSLFMIFGIPNGKNNTKDISAFLSGKENYDTNVNFVSFLYEDLSIYNNIF